MQIADKYSPQEIEQKWYDYWIDNRLFHSEPDGREPYTIVIPPPNVTGMLHMGHMLNNTLQDVLIRRARMSGKNACWVPGMDHASIATEAKVVAMLHEKGIEKSSLTREEFLGIRMGVEGKIRRHDPQAAAQAGRLVRLGAHLLHDGRTPHRERHASVFCDLYEKGKIYRGVRMVNWDPAAQTALSDEEVVFKESHGKLYYLRYMVEGSDKAVIVATTRPETILGDTALCVNPNDPRYGWLAGRGARHRTAGEPRNPRNPRRIRRYRVRYGRAESDPGARRERLHAGREIQPRGDRHLQRRRHDQRQSGAVRRHGSFRRPQKDRRRPGGSRPAGEDRGLYQQRGLFGAHGRGHRAETLDAVVPLDGAIGRTGDEGRHGGRDPLRARKIQEHLPPLDGEHQGLVHLAPAVVGPAHSGLVPAPRRLRSGPDGRGGARKGARENRRRLVAAVRPQTGRRRAGHVVLVVAVAYFGLRRHPQPRQQGDQLLLPHQRPGDGPRHHLLLGGAHDHGRVTNTAAKNLSETSISRASSATRSAARCPSSWATRPTRST